MRTKLKNQKYFETYLELNDEDIEFYLQGLNSGETAKDRIPAVRRQIFTTSLHSVIAKYSAGFPIEEMKSDFTQVIGNLNDGWQNDNSAISFDNYVLMLWMLSLGRLLEIDTNEFSKIVEVLDRSKRSDRIYDLIISDVLKDREISQNILFESQFGFLLELFETRNIAVLQSNLEKAWYGNMKLAYWYDNDKNKNDVFFGYWSFESGAIVKILRMDDSSMKNQQYYPYDLVHWKD